VRPGGVLISAIDAITASEEGLLLRGQHIPNCELYEKIVRKLHVRDPSAMDDLKVAFSQGLRLLLKRRGYHETEGMASSILRQVADSISNWSDFDARVLPSLVYACLRAVPIQEGPRRPPLSPALQQLSKSLKTNEKEAVILHNRFRIPQSEVCRRTGVEEKFFDILRATIKSSGGNLNKARATFP